MQKAVKVLRKGFSTPEVQIFISGIPGLWLQLNHVRDELSKITVTNLLQECIFRVVFSLPIPEELG